MIPPAIQQAREQFNAAVQARKHAEAEVDRLRKALYATLTVHKPVSFRLQEALELPDGSFAAPHWDEVSPYAGQHLIDQNELEFLVLHEGEWLGSFDEPTPGSRRVIDVVYQTES